MGFLLSRHVLSDLRQMVMPLATGQRRLITFMICVPGRVARHRCRVGIFSEEAIFPDVFPDAVNVCPCRPCTKVD